MTVFRSLVWAARCTAKSRNIYIYIYRGHHDRHCDCEAGGDGEQDWDPVVDVVDHARDDHLKTRGGR